MRQHRAPDNRRTPHIALLRAACRLGCAVCLLAGVLVAPALHAQAAAPAPKSLRVALIDNYPPFVTMGESGRLEGYEVDRWKLFAAHTGIDVKLVAASWDTASAAVSSGAADVIDPIYRNPAREADYDFSPPYANLPASVYVDHRLRGIHGPAALRGRTIGVARSSICAHELDHLGIAGQRRFADAREVVQAAARGRLDVFCMDENKAHYYLRRFPEIDRFDRSFVLQTGEFQWAVRRGNTAVFDLVARGMARITPAEQETLRQRWLARPPAATLYERLAGSALIAVLALVALMLLWVWMLRRAVARHTGALRAQEGKLRALFDTSPYAMWVKDRSGVYLDCNDVVLHTLRRPREDIVGHNDLELFGPAYTAELREMDVRTIHGGRRCSSVMAIDFGAGMGMRQMEVVNVPLLDADGDAYGTFGTGRDITDQVRADAELRLAAVAFQTQDALLVMDARRMIQRANKAFEQLSGYTAADVVGRPSALIRSGHHDEAFYAHLWEQVDSHGFWQGEYWLRVKSGRPRVVRMAVSAVCDESGVVSHYVASMVDLTAEREAHASVDHMTFFDPLTDLPNRHYLLGRLQQLQDDRESRGAMLLLFDLDHFKRVNDLRGHATGDWLLVQVAQRLRRRLQEDCVLSRFGGGTFALLERRSRGDHRTVEACTTQCADGIRAALREPFVQAGAAPMVVTVSIGWTWLSPGQATPDASLKEAELAMYEAKAKGRDQVFRYVPSMQADLARREALVHDLCSAIADGALALHLQAQTDRSGRIVGAEGLLRWTRPCGEQVPPSVFIPLAEENGLIVGLGNWVLQRACELLAQWATTPATRELTLAVNVSAKQFARPGFVDAVRAVLVAHGTDPARLKLEVTESAILDDLDEAADKLSQLRALGMRISLDDFGTGYSSLAYLSRLPLDQLKIDQSFVARLPDSASDAMVARTIIGMGRGLGLEVIAEGVETDAQHAFLLGRGCNAFQGFLISQPVAPRAFEALLAGQPVVTSPAGS